MHKIITGYCWWQVRHIDPTGARGRKQEQGEGRRQLTAINYQREYIRRSRNRSFLLTGRATRCGKANKRGLQGRTGARSPSCRFTGFSPGDQHRERVTVPPQPGQLQTQPCAGNSRASLALNKVGFLYVEDPWQGAL